MTTEVQKLRMERCIGFLRPLQASFSETISETHWVGARNADPDQGSSYCRACCDKLVEQLNAKHPEHEYLRDGGWGSDSDSQEICEECGDFLACSLTEYGIGQELDHWSRARVTLHGRYAATTAFQLLQILESECLNDYWLTAPGKHQYQIDSIRRIHRDTHALTRRIDAIRDRATKKEASNAG